MSYDNSQLARVYLHAWQVTGSEFFRTITEEILDYVVREMLDPEGVQMLRTQHLPSSSSSTGTAGFYSPQDADSEGEEGKFFVWTPAEIRDVLGSDAEAFMAAYGVTSGGNASQARHKYRGQEHPQIRQRHGPVPYADQTSPGAIRGPGRTGASLL